ncbi:MAG: hypothetical protein K0U29_06570 [Gammaproteobacteria bacterium]|nr:hypothetical protein [Gammaproteobacteria bacterium]MCH9744578.1 hypothetical protein [Gammaproteobacteria bacterium]
MNQIEGKMAASDASYASPMAKNCSRFGILSMLFGIFILLSWVNLNFAHTWSISFTWLCYIVLVIYYYFLDVKLAVVATVVMFIFTLIATLIGGHYPTTANIILFLIFFVGGLASVLIGHYVIEKKKASLLNNLQECLIIPLYAMVECLQVCGLGSMFGVSDNKAHSAPTHETEHMHDHSHDNDHSNDHESK